MLPEMKRDHFRCLKSPSQRLKVTEAIFILGLDSDLNVFAHSHTTRIGMFYRLRLLHINDTLTQLDRAMLDAFKEMYCSPDIFSARRVAIRLWKESGLDVLKVGPSAKKAFHRHIDKAYQISRAKEADEKAKAYGLMITGLLNDFVGGSLHSHPTPKRPRCDGEPPELGRSAMSAEVLTRMFKA